MNFDAYLSMIRQREEEEKEEYERAWAKFCDEEYVTGSVERMSAFNAKITMLDIDEFGYLDDYGYPCKDTPEVIKETIPQKHLSPKLRRQRRLSLKNRKRDKAKHGINMRYWLPRNKRQFDHFVWVNEPDKGQVKAKQSFWRHELELLSCF